MQDPPAPERRPCPVCGQALVKMRYRNVPADVCGSHGMWLDSGELEDLLGKERRTRLALQVHARKQGRREGALAGWWFEWIALLFPNATARLFEEAPPERRDRERPAAGKRRSRPG